MDKNYPYPHYTPMSTAYGRALVRLAQPPDQENDDIDHDADTVILTPEPGPAPNPPQGPVEMDVDEEPVVEADQEPLVVEPAVEGDVVQPLEDPQAVVIMEVDNEEEPVGEEAVALEDAVTPPMTPAPGVPPYPQNPLFHVDDGQVAGPSSRPPHIPSNAMELNENPDGTAGPKHQYPTMCVTLSKDLPAGSQIYLFHPRYTNPFSLPLPRVDKPDGHALHFPDDTGYIDRPVSEEEEEEESD